MVMLGFPGVKGSSELTGTELTGLWHTRCLQPLEASLAWAFFVPWRFSQQPEQAWHIAVV